MKTIVAIIAIVLLDGWAIYNGINGALLCGSVGAIAGLGGYAIGTKKKPE